MNIKWDNAIKHLTQGSIHVALLLESIRFRFRFVGDIKERNAQEYELSEGIYYKVELS